MSQLNAARLRADGLAKGWLFRTSRGHDGTVLSEKTGTARASMTETMVRCDG